MMNKPLTFGIIGAGIALAVVVGVLFVMPLVTAPAPKALQPQQQDPERQQILETPNTGQPGQPIIKHQELRAQDPIFDRYMLVQEECFNNLENNIDPNVAGCGQAFEYGLEQ
jgi:hypothetical protein